MKDRYTCKINILIFFLLINSDINAQLLAVPEIEQEQNQWCWAGVSKCVLDYYGFVNQQCIIAEYARSQNSLQFGSIDCCVNPSSCNNWNYIFGAGIGGIDDILYNFGSITTTNIYTALSETQWQTEISNGTPFIIRYGWNNGGGHFVVGYGVLGPDYFTMDPWFNEGYTISNYNWVLTAQGGSGTWTHSQILTPPSIIMGCTDTSACNYNSVATTNDGSCNYSSVSYDTLVSAISISWNGNILSISGDYSDTLINSAGCDSVSNLNLTITNITDVLYLTNKRKTVNVYNMLGKKESYVRNTPLFFIYDDGTVEKRIVIE